MSRFFLPLLVALLMGSLHAGAQPARGLIVKLKDADAVATTIGAAREQPRLLRERLSALAQDSGGTVRDAAPIGRGHHLMRFSRPLEGQALEDAARRMRLHPDVAWVEPDVLMKPLQVTPNDSFYLLNRQAYLDVPANYPAGVNLPPAWARTTGNDVIVAVLDTGVRFDHPDLAGKLLAGYDFVSEDGYDNDAEPGRDADASDPGDFVSTADKTGNPALFGSCARADSTWHGTFIAGQIAALTNNVTGVAGVNWGTRVLPVRVSGKCGAFLSDILDGMRWAAGLSVAGVPANPNRARIINLSFGGDISCTASYQDVINEVTAAGSLVVVAAGNDNAAPRRPADCKNVLAVGAVQSNGLKTSYSNFGPTVALSTPGGFGSSTNTYIASTTNLGTTTPTPSGLFDYGYKLGTSFTAPLGAGVASLMLSLNPNLPPTQLIARLKASARPHLSAGGAPTCGAGVSVPCNCTTATCGSGLLDADRATLAALNPVALIAPVGTPGYGATVTLDGRSSAAVAGSSIISSQWTQVAGTPLAIQNAASPLASVVLPSTSGTFTFRLLVTDNLSRVGEEFVTVTLASETTPVAPGTDPAGSGSSGGGGGGTLSWLWGAGLWLLALWAWRRRAAWTP